VGGEEVVRHPNRQKNCFIREGGGREEAVQLGDPSGREGEGTKEISRLAREGCSTNRGKGKQRGTENGPAPSKREGKGGKRRSQGVDGQGRAIPMWKGSCLV